MAHTVPSLVVLGFLAGSVLSCAATAPVSPKGTVHRSADLGWTAGQDVTKQFSALLTSGAIKPGDTLLLDHTYRISGSYELPDNFTLSARQGAGFEVTDAVGDVNNKAFLILGDNNTLRNVTITYLNTPPLGPTGEEPGVTFTRKTGIQATGKSGLLFEHCRLVGSIGHHVKLSDKCDKPRFIGCHIAGGHWSFYISVEDAVFRNCVFEKCQGDGIKTQWAKRVLVDECVFQDNLRDGIDTTGGFDDSIVRNTVFRRNRVSGMDLKAHYGNESDLDSPENVGIRIENCQFTDTRNGIVLTTLDRNGHLTADNAEEFAPHDIDIVDCVFGRTSAATEELTVTYPSDLGEKMRMLHVKGAHSIRYHDSRFFGQDIMVVDYQNLGGTRHITQEAADKLNHSVSGTVAGPVQPPVAGDRSIPFAYGPQPMP